MWMVYVALGIAILLVVFDTVVIYLQKATINSQGELIEAEQVHIRKMMALHSESTLANDRMQGFLELLVKDMDALEAWSLKHKDQLEALKFGLSPEWQKFSLDCLLRGASSKIDLVASRERINDLGPKQDS